MKLKKGIDSVPGNVGEGSLLSGKRPEEYSHGNGSSHKVATQKTLFEQEDRCWWAEYGNKHVVTLLLE